MGSLAAQSQRIDVLEKLDILRKESQLVYGDPSRMDVIDANYDQGAFLSPMLLVNDDPFKKTATHEVEAFGPITTLMPYDTLEDAVALTKMGKGSLVCSITTHDNRIARDFVLESASHHGRILVLNRESAPESTGHGSPMPLLVHGGWRRRDGGEARCDALFATNRNSRFAIHTDRNYARISIWRFSAGG
jgi:oxepin-CoA hydrolase/3-oxo-5,6-dehydrosuberyl-CoA semialdehyde dehydrogenase